MQPYTLRQETPADFTQVEQLTREAFWNVYKPGCDEHLILHKLRSRPHFIPELSLVLEVEGQIIGHIMYVHSEVRCDDGRTLPTLTFGPISIDPRFQRQGYGKALVDASLEAARAFGCAVLITGNIAFYRHCGFVIASSRGLHYEGLPREDEAPFFLLRELNPGFFDGITATYAEPPGYETDPEELAAFDAHFPPKPKLKLPGQLG